MPASFAGSEFKLASSESKNPFTVVSGMPHPSFLSKKMNSDSFGSTLPPLPRLVNGGVFASNRFPNRFPVI
jgi:hypothetical protein